MLHGPILGTLTRMAWPNTLMMLAQSSTGLVESWYFSKLGAEVLAGVSVVVPLLMLMQNMSQGAMGGGISSAIARALGGGSLKDAQVIARNAAALHLVIGTACAVVLLLFGRPLYRSMGVDGAALDAAVSYSNIIFATTPLLWSMSAFASIIRGSGNMLVPSAVMCIGAVLLVPAAALLIFGLGPFRGLGVVGGALAIVAYHVIGNVLLGLYCFSGRNLVKLRLGALSWAPMASILRVGAVACANSSITNALIGASTALVGAKFGAVALAGYGTAVRLEYMLMPIAFGFGAPMVAMVGANMGAGQAERARKIALTGGLVAGALGMLAGLSACFFAVEWMRLFGADHDLAATGALYLQTVGPVYGFFTLGMSLYFASQGAGSLKYPILGGLLRLAVSIGIGALVLSWTGSLLAFCLTWACAMVLYGSLIFWSVFTGQWSKRRAPMTSDRHAAGAVPSSSLKA